MRRTIPKQSKTEFTFKGINLRDMAFLSCALALFVVLIVANFAGSLYIAVGVLALAAVMFFVKIDDRLYYELYSYFLYLFSKKKWEGEDQSGISYIDDDVVQFKDGYCCGVIKIHGNEFFLLREEEQDRYINVFSVVFMNLARGQKLSIIRLDRPVFLDGQIEALKERLTAEETEELSEQAKEYIKQIRLEELKKINTNDNCFYYNAFYLVLYSSTRADLHKTLSMDLRELQAGGIKAERISGTELYGFCRRTVTAAFDERELKELPAKEEQGKLLAPMEVQFHTKTAKVDGITEKTYVITRYPTEAFNAWATELFSMPYTKVVISATPIDPQKAVKAIDRTVAELKEKYEHSSKMSSDTQTVMHYESMQTLMEQLQSSNEVMLNVCTSVTYYDYKDEGRDAFKSIRKAINRMGFQTSGMICKQGEAYRLGMLNAQFPLRSCVYTQGINSSSLAGAYPFVDTQILEEGGVMLGQNTSPVIVNFLKRGDFYKNSNIVVLGGVGGGKSFFAKTLFTNLKSEGLRIFILDPENEYSILAENIGGKVIDMGMGGNIINPFAVLCDMNDDDEENVVGNLLLSHITFLEEFFRTTLTGLGSENIELVLSLLPELYRQKGITERTNFKKYAGDFPTFDELIELFKNRLKNKMTANERAAHRTIITFLSKFAKGGRFSFLWNGQTNLVANEEFTVFNFQTLLANANKTIVAAQMLLLTQYLNNELIRNYNRIKRGVKAAQIVIAVDEAHVFIDPHNPIALRFMKNSAKRCRKYGGMQIVLTQSVNDFIGNEDLERESKAVITECQYTFVFPLNASGTADFLQLYDKLDITTEEENAILDLPRGTTFFIAHQRMRTKFAVVTPQAIRDLFEKKVEISKEMQDMKDEQEAQRAEDLQEALSSEVAVEAEQTAEPSPGEADVQEMQDEQEAQPPAIELAEELEDPAGSDVADEGEKNN